MSRIYDALQRAEVERKGSATLEDERVAEEAMISASDVFSPIEAASTPLSIACNPWKASLDSLPTLANRGRGVEEFRSLRSSIYQLRQQQTLKTVLVSSGMPAEGKTFIAGNLAISLGRNNCRVLLIDGDLRRPSVHKLLGTHNTRGLAEYLDGNATLTDILQRNSEPLLVDADGPSPISSLCFIPGGQGGDRAPELISNHRFDELIATLSPHFDWIVIDSPPVLVVSDAADLAHAADAVLLVARAAITPFNVVQRAQAAFSNSRILGLVLNAMKDAPRGGSYYYYDEIETSHKAPR